MTSTITRSVSTSGKMDRAAGSTTKFGTKQKQTSKSCSLLGVILSGAAFQAERRISRSTGSARKPNCITAGDSKHSYRYDVDAHSQFASTRELHHETRIAQYPQCGQDLWPQRGAAKYFTGNRRGRIPHNPGRKRIRENHAAAHHRGLRERDLWRSLDGRGAPRRSTALPAPRQHRIPELRAVSAPHGRAKRRLRVARSPPAGG